MRLIINADDLGISHDVNRCIFELMSAGKVTSATLIANGPAAEEAAKRVPEFPDCSFGVHLNVTRFKPLTVGAHFGSLVGQSGEFCGTARTRWLDRVQRQAVYAEWCSQIRRARSLGLEPSHLDSHDYVHTKPELFFVLKRVQRVFGIRKVRITRNIFPTSRRCDLLLKFKKRLWNGALRRIYRTRTTEGFCSLATFVAAAKHGDVRFETVEVGVHPCNPLFAEENTLLESPWRAQLPIRCELVNYHDV